MFTKIVWATDGSENADRALAYAIELAERDGAEVHVCHVIEKIAVSRVAGQDVHLNEQELDEKIRRQADGVAGNDVKVTLHMSSDQAADVARRIADTATEVGADLILVGTRGHSPIVGALLGSVSQRLLHIAACPVLVVPPITARQPAAESLVTG
jgi:nucleotide-binding universal stress UspA family protein